MKLEGLLGQYELLGAISTDNSSIILTMDKMLEIKKGIAETTYKLKQLKAKGDYK